MSPRLSGRSLARLYPRGWRARYEEEFVALLDDVPLSPAVVGDVLARAALAQLGELIVRSGRGWRHVALTQKGTSMIRTLLAVLVLGTTAVATFGTLHAIWFDPDVSALRVFVAISFAVPVAVGVLTLAALVQDAPNAQKGLARATAAAALLLIPIGIVGVIGVLLIGRSSGDYEWAIAATNAALVVQGVLTALYFSDRLRGRGLLAS